MNTIKTFKRMVLAGLASGLVAIAAAPENPGAPGNKPEDPGSQGQGRKPENPGGGRPEVPGVGLRIPKDAVLPDALKKALDEFNALRQKQVEAQSALRAQLGTATAEEKAKIKEQLKANQDKFLEDTKQLRSDIREQIKALRATLKDTPPVDGGDQGGKGKGRKGG